MPRFTRLSEEHRPRIVFRIDGKEAVALAGDTLLTAALSNGAPLRTSEFGDGQRAGFCLMGACQDCWVWLADGRRLQACMTYVDETMDILPSRTGIRP